jgi:general secretion pathway protein A
MMYKEFYGFREKPFGLAADPGYLYLSSKHRLALSYLEYALLDGAGFALLTGEIGSGKTTIIKQLLLQIGRDIATAVVFNTNVSPEQLLETILQEFDLERPQGGKTQYWEVLNQFLLDRYSRGHRAVLIVDEAQNLSVEALEEIRMISNLQTDKESLLQVILVGQPALRARLPSYAPSARSGAGRSWRVTRLVSPGARAGKGFGVATRIHGSSGRAMSMASLAAPP